MGWQKYQFLLQFMRKVVVSLTKNPISYHYFSKIIAKIEIFSHVFSNISPGYDTVPQTNSAKLINSLHYGKQPWQGGFYMNEHKNAFILRSVVGVVYFKNNNKTYTSFYILATQVMSTSKSGSNSNKKNLNLERLQSFDKEPRNPLNGICSGHKRKSP